MHPSKVTLRPKVRRPMAWDSTKSAPSAQQPEPSTQCPIPGGYRRAETRHHRIHHPDLLRTARRNQTPSRAILQAVDAMMAPSVRHLGRETSSASNRQSDRVTDPIHGLERVRSGPIIAPVEPVVLLDPKGGGCVVSWHGRACEVDGVVSGGRARRGGGRGSD